MYKTNYGGDTYYTNILFDEIENLLSGQTLDSQDVYDERYKDLNIVPSFDNLAIPEMHVEFRALNNLINIGGGINHHITDKFGNIYNFLSIFAKYVSILFEKVFNDLDLIRSTDFENEYFANDSLLPEAFDESNLRFGIEIETCTHIEP